MVVLFIGGIALALKPSIKWIKGQLLHMERAAHQNSLKEQNRLNWCAYVLATSPETGSGGAAIVGNQWAPPAVRQGGNFGPFRGIGPAS